MQNERNECDMAHSLVQIRLDDELKAETTAVYEALGIDLPTAVRMFIKRSVQYDASCRRI